MRLWLGGGEKASVEALECWSNKSWLKLGEKRYAIKPEDERGDKRKRLYYVQSWSGSRAGDSHNLEHIAGGHSLERDCMCHQYCNKS